MQLLINDRFEAFYLKEFEKIGIRIKQKEFLRYVNTKLKILTKNAKRVDVQKYE